jgi:hypothetical protein
MSLGNKIILIFLMIPLFVSYGWGMCALPEPSETKIIVESCEVIDPYQVSRLTDFAERYPKGFGNQKEAEKRAQRVVESYKGAVLVENQGSKTEKYFLSNKDEKVCQTFKKGTSVRALVAFACCDGDPNPPCYLGFSRYLARILEPGVK